MKNTIRYVLFLFIVTNLVFSSGCFLLPDPSESGDDATKVEEMTDDDQAEEEDNDDEEGDEVEDDSEVIPTEAVSENTEETVESEVVAGETPVEEAATEEEATESADEESSTDASTESGSEEAPVEEETPADSSESSDNESAEGTAPAEEASPEEEATPEESIEETPAEEEAPATEATSMYSDGVHTASGDYISPAGSEKMNVSLTIDSDVVTGVTVTPMAENDVSRQYQEGFGKSVVGHVVGKNIDELGPLSIVSGASLTTNGFNQALSAIKSSAKN